MDDLNHDGFRTLVDLNIMLKNWSDELAEVNTQMKLNWGIKTNQKAIFVCRTPCNLMEIYNEFSF